jgi:hypothetical protein
MLPTLGEIDQETFWSAAPLASAVNCIECPAANKVDEGEIDNAPHSAVSVTWAMYP